MAFASETGTAPSVKKQFPGPRAGLTCEECRRRKVRCDLVVNGKCCTNCRLDGRDCRPNLQRRRRKTATAERKLRFGVATTERTVKLDLGLNTSSEKNEAVNEHANLEEAAFVGAIVISSGICSSDDENDDEEGFDCADKIRTLSVHKSSHTLQYLDSLQRDSISRCGQLQPHASINIWQANVAANPLTIPLSKIQYPGSLQPLSSHFDAWGLQGLGTRGPTAMFSSELQNAILCAYVNFVYPSLPIIDLPATLGAIMLNDRTYTIHSALFHAILLLGAQCVPGETWQSAGCGTKAATLAQLHKSVDVLYERIQEPVTRLQVALHMTHSWENRHKGRESLAWLITALKLAQYLGLPSRINLPNPAERNSIHTALCKRIWYSCVMRDAMVAIEHEIRPLLSNIDPGICTMVLTDFELQHSEKPPWANLHGSWICDDVDNWKVFADQFIGLVKLCTCIPSALSLRDPILGYVGSTAALLGDITPQSVPERIWQCAVDDLLAPSETDECLGRTTQEHCAVTVQKAIVDGLYCSLLCKIYLTSTSESHFKSGRWRGTAGQVSTDEAQASAKIISTVAEKLLIDDLIQYLPAISVQIFLAAVTTLLDDSNLSKVAVREQVVKHLRPCIQSLAELSKSYPSAHCALSWAAESSELVASLSAMISVASS